MKRIHFAGAAFAVLVLAGQGCTPQDQQSPDTQEAMEDEVMMEETVTYTFPGVLPADQIENKQVRLTTQKGDIVFELYPDTAPTAVSNFVYLAQQGFYDGVVFHRVVPGFVIQGGDPTGTGAGGPGYTFEDELDDDRTYDRGIVAMANRGPDTNGSQFFIMLEDYTFEMLAKDYTIFGNVLSGLEIVDTIAEGDVIEKVRIEERQSAE